MKIDKLGEQKEKTLTPKQASLLASRYVLILSALAEKGIGLGMRIDPNLSGTVKLSILARNGQLTIEQAREVLSSLGTKEAEAVPDQYGLRVYQGQTEDGVKFKLPTTVCYTGEAPVMVEIKQKRKRRISKKIRAVCGEWANKMQEKPLP